MTELQCNEQNRIANKVKATFACSFLFTHKNITGKARNKLVCVDRTCRVYKFPVHPLCAPANTPKPEAASDNYQPHDYIDSSLAFT